MAVDGLTPDEAKWRLTMLSLDPHTSLNEYITYLLVGLASSKNTKARYMAVAHKLLPEAKLVMMQNDPDDEIRAMVKARLEYGDSK